MKTDQLLAELEVQLAARRERKMSDYKLVPVEPTTAMREVWKRMRGYCWYDKYKAMLAAAPAVQGEPVAVPTGFRVMKPTSSVVRDGDRWEIYAPCGSGGIVHEDEVTDWVVRKLLDALATAPQPAEQQPAPDVEALVEALARCRHQASYSIGDNEALSRQLAKVRNIVNEALAAYRKGGQP